MEIVMGIVAFSAGDKVVLDFGPHKFVSGTFIGLKKDVKWAAIKQADGLIRSHPVEWLIHDLSGVAERHEA
jgi:hypothetical protein